IEIVLRFDFRSLDFAERDVCRHFLAGVIEAYGAFVLPAVGSHRQLELTAGAESATPVDYVIALNCVLRERMPAKNQDKEAAAHQAPHAVKIAAGPRLRKPRSPVRVDWVTGPAPGRASGRGRRPSSLNKIHHRRIRVEPHTRAFACTHGVK